MRSDFNMPLNTPDVRPIQSHDFFHAQPCQIIGFKQSVIGRQIVLAMPKLVRDLCGSQEKA
jgi:hypothetical protein